MWARASVVVFGSAGSVRFATWTKGGVWLTWGGAEVQRRVLRESDSQRNTRRRPLTFFIFYFFVASFCLMTWEEDWLRT
ncbi:hypothetical protein TorRG33x02_309710 [Trema orientale]|uniref:Uncharacterized protein n=1 Tax=Trema orientale TaxID=63057 RepID=A0A2P5BTA7_TREOI|nr:hypothetical protein TorRG33x02_309710 [Trema orientale]